eukprot:4047245-Pyramimonas_sp.AAC.3
MNSLLYAMPDVSAMLVKINAQRFITYGGAFGATSRKPWEMFTTWAMGAMQFLIRTQREADTMVAGAIGAQKCSVGYGSKRLI